MTCLLKVRHAFENFSEPCPKMNLKKSKFRSNIPHFMPSTSCLQSSLRENCRDI